MDLPCHGPARIRPVPTGVPSRSDDARRVRVPGERQDDADRRQARHHGPEVAAPDEGHLRALPHQRSARGDPAAPARHGRRAATAVLPALHRHHPRLRESVPGVAVAELQRISDRDCRRRRDQCVSPSRPHQLRLLEGRELPATEAQRVRPHPPQGPEPPHRAGRSAVPGRAECRDAPDREARREGVIRGGVLLLRRDVHLG